MNNRIGIIGAGTMGESLTHCLIDNGYDVLLYDVSADKIHKAIKNIDTRIGVSQILHGKKKRIKGNILIAEDLHEFHSIEIIIENIFENANAKKALYNRLDEIIQETCIYMINTSCISITEIVSNAKHQDRVIGTHFMNPVSSINTVEIIKSYYTSDCSLNKTVHFINELGKECIVINDSPGFVSNRISHLMMNEAAFLVESNVATPESIDQIFIKCYGHKMGPLATADLIGIDVVVASLEILYSNFQDSKFRCCPLLKKMVYANLLGRKTKRGFFEYE